MGKKTKAGKERLDKYYHLAKEQGYRARSAFKLIQLTQKHDIFSSCRCLIDLCAAPGGWLQVAQKNMPVASTIIGVDLVPIHPIRGVTTFQCDITTQRCRSLLRAEVPQTGCDVVLHDGAPNVGMAWSHDAFTQNELVLKATELACEFLRKGGTYITKVFRSQDYASLMWMFQQLFEKVTATKPSSSRAVSAEIFVICSKFKKPSKVDPKFFDSRHIFVNVDAPQVLPATDSKQKRGLRELVDGLSRRNRQGYEEGSEYKEASVLSFFDSPTPVEFLIGHHKLLFEFSAADDEKEKYEMICSSKHTTDEIKTLCNDLRVLGKGDYAALIKWRLRVMKTFPNSTDTKKENVKLIPEEELNEEEVLIKTMEILAAEEKKRKLNEKRKVHQDKKKRDLLKARSMVITGTMEDGGDLFNCKQGLEAFAIEDEILERRGCLEYDNIDNPPSDDEELIGKSRVVLSTDPSRVAELAEDIEASIQQEKEFMTKQDLRREMRQKKLTKRQRVYSEWAQEIQSFANHTQGLAAEKWKETAQDGSDQENDEFPPNVYKDDSDTEMPIPDTSNTTAATSGTSNLHDSEPLNLDLKDRWFQQQLFVDAGLGSDCEFSDTESEGDDNVLIVEKEVPELPLNDRQVRKLKRKQELDKANAKAARQASNLNALGVPVDDGKFDGDKFEVVPIGYSDQIPLSDDEMPEELKPATTQQEKDELHSVALLMKNKAHRMDLIDGAFNRFAFNDSSDVPRWFTEEERLHARPELPVTKELMREYSRKLKEISRRPIRKVLEAAGRKKLRLQKKLSQVKKQAEIIADSNEQSEFTKSKSINKLVKKAHRDTKPKVTYVVSQNPGRQRNAKGQSGGRIRVVDKRMKKDKRAKKRAEKKRK